MNETQNILPVRAISLIELLLVLTVIAAITLTSIKLYVNARAEAKVAQVVAQTNKLAEASYRWLDLQKQSDFCGSVTYVNNYPICTNPISNQKILDQGLAKSSDFISPWGKIVFVQAAESSGVGIYIVFNNTNPKLCNLLVKSLKDKVIKIKDIPQIGCENSLSWQGIQFFANF